MAEQHEEEHDLSGDEGMDYLVNNEMIVTSSEEDEPNADHPFPRDDELEIVVSDSDEDNEIVVSDSDESDEEIVVSDSDDSDEELLFTDSESDGEGIVADVENDQQQNQIFREFFQLNIERRGLDDPLLVQQANVRKYELLLIEIAQVLRYKGPYVSLLASLKKANMIFDDCSFPTTMDGLWKLLERNLDNFNQSIVCTICWENLGAVKIPGRNCECGNTGPGKTEELGTFLYLNLPAQLQALLRKTNMATDLEYPWTRIKRNVQAMEDVYDGRVYRELSAEGEFLARGSNNYSFAIWTDGVDPVVSAPVQIWPVFVQVLELSPRARQRHSLLAALYVGPKKPVMGKFLHPFARQLRDLYTDGIIWRSNRGAEVRSRFVTLILAADSEARYELLAHTRHNGYWGCTFCYAQGVRVGDQHRFHMYPYYDGDADQQMDFAPDRTDEDIRRDSVEAVEAGASVHGVRGISPFYIVPGIDLRKFALIEQLHVWERNMPRLYERLTDPATPNYITPQSIIEISDRLQKIKPPTKLSRRPRALKHFGKYKATEYRNLAWFYWLPCAHNVMSAEHIEHFRLFAEASYLLNMESILPDDLRRARDLYDEYRRQSAELFDERYQSYSLHLLKHAARCVNELGPQWVASGFWFESLNRTIRNYITSPTDRSMQIACRMLLAQFVEKSLDWPLSPAVRGFLQELVNKKRWAVPPQNATGRFIQHGRGVPGVLDQQEIAALIQAGYANENEDLAITQYKRVIIDGITYQTPNERSVKYDNSVIHITPRMNTDLLEFIRISSIISWQRGAETMNGVIGCKFPTVRAAFNTSYMKIVEESEDLVYLPLTCINAPAVLVESLGNLYISPLPNRWDVD